MQKTVVIMQPGYIPWLGFFELLAQSDVFVLYDNVQYDKNGWRNRNRIKTPNGPLWLTVPVTLPNGLKTKINEARIVQDGWRKKHIGSIAQFYRQAPFLKEYFPEFKDLLEQKWETLIDLDIAAIKLFQKWLGNSSEIVRASDLGIDEADKVERLINIVRHLGGNRFYEPAGGATYIKEAELKRFQEAGIQFEFQRYIHPTYRQLHGEFTPCLSILDLLLNEGPESSKILTSTYQKEVA